MLAAMVMGWDDIMVYFRRLPRRADAPDAEAAATSKPGPPGELLHERQDAVAVGPSAGGVSPSRRGVLAEALGDSVPHGLLHECLDRGVNVLIDRLVPLLQHTLALLERTERVPGRA